MEQLFSETDKLQTKNTLMLKENVGLQSLYLRLSLVILMDIKWKIQQISKQWILICLFRL